MPPLVHWTSLKCIFANHTLNCFKLANNQKVTEDSRTYFTFRKVIEKKNCFISASECSTEELVCAYQIACEKHGIKPLPKLLHQLKVKNEQKTKIVC